MMESIHKYPECMKTGLFSIRAVSIFLFAFMLLLPALSLAAAVNILERGETKATATLGEKAMVDISIPLDNILPNTPEDEIEIHVAVQPFRQSEWLIKRILIYKCLDKLPDACAADVTPDPFGSIVDKPIKWKDMKYKSGDGEFQEKANILVLVRLERNDIRQADPSWAGFFYTIERKAKDNFVPPNVVDPGQVNINSNGLVSADFMKGFIEDRHMLPIVWADGITFANAESLINLSVEQSSFQQEKPPVIATNTGNNQKDKNIIKASGRDVSLVLAKIGSSYAFALPVFRNPTYQCGNNLKEDKLGETSKNCCVDAGCGQGQYCSISDISKPSLGACKEDNIGLSASAQTLKLKNCLEDARVPVHVTVTNPPPLADKLAVKAFFDSEGKKAEAEASCSGQSGVYACSFPLDMSAYCSSKSSSFKARVTTEIRFNNGFTPAAKKLEADLQSEVRVEFAEPVGIEVPSAVDVPDCSKPKGIVKAKITGINYLPSSLSGSVTLSGAAYSMECKSSGGSAGNEYDCEFSLPSVNECSPVKSEFTGAVFEVQMPRSSGEAKAVKATIMKLAVNYACSCKDEKQYCDKDQKKCLDRTDIKLLILDSPTTISNSAVQGGSVDIAIKVKVEPKPGGMKLIEKAKLKIDSIVSDTEEKSREFGITCAESGQEIACSGSIAIAGYKPEKRFDLKGNKLGLDIIYTDGAAEKTKSFLESLPNIAIPSSECGNGKQEAGETKDSCCLDVACGSEEYCDESRACKKSSDISISSIALDKSSFDSCKVDHDIKLTASLNNAPKDATLDKFEYWQGDKKYEPNPQCGYRGAAIECALKILPIQACKMPVHTITGNKLKVEIGVMDQNTRQPKAVPLEKEFQNIEIKPTFTPGDGICDKDYGETAEVACIECPCEQDERYKGHYCELTQDKPFGTCKKKEDIKLAVDQPATQVTFDSCSIDNTLQVKARIDGIPSSMRVESELAAINGRNVDLVTCQETGTAAGRKSYDCNILVEADRNCQAQLTYKGNSLSIQVSYLDGTKPAEPKTLTSPLPDIFFRGSAQQPGSGGGGSPGTGGGGTPGTTQDPSIAEKARHARQQLEATVAQFDIVQQQMQKEVSACNTWGWVVDLLEVGTKALIGCVLPILIPGFPPTCDEALTSIVKDDLGLGGILSDLAGKFGGQINSQAGSAGGQTNAPKISGGGGSAQTDGRGGQEFQNPDIPYGIRFQASGTPEIGPNLLYFGIDKVFDIWRGILGGNCRMTQLELDRLKEQKIQAIAFAKMDVCEADSQLMIDRGDCKGQESVCTATLQACLANAKQLLDDSRQREKEINERINKEMKENEERLKKAVTKNTGTMAGRIGAALLDCKNGNLCCGVADKDNDGVYEPSTVSVISQSICEKSKDGAVCVYVCKDIGNGKQECHPSSPEPCTSPVSVNIKVEGYNDLEAWCDAGGGKVSVGSIGVCYCQGTTGQGGGCDQNGNCAKAWEKCLGTTGGGTAPTVDFECMPYPQSSKIICASASKAGSGSIKSYSWGLTAYQSAAPIFSVSPDGTQLIIPHTFLASKTVTYTISLKITDSQGGEASRTKEIEVQGEKISVKSDTKSAPGGTQGKPDFAVYDPRLSTDKKNVEFTIEYKGTAKEDKVEIMAAKWDKKSDQFTVYPPTPISIKDFEKDRKPTGHISVGDVPKDIEVGVWIDPATRIDEVDEDNNDIKFKITSDGQFKVLDAGSAAKSGSSQSGTDKPDLEVVGTGKENFATYSTIPTPAWLVAFLVESNGKDSGPFSAGVFVDGKLYQDSRLTAGKIITKLEKGKTEELRYPIEMDKDKHTIELRADYNKEVDESNEANNIVRIEVENGKILSELKIAKTAIYRIKGFPVVSGKIVLECGQNDKEEIDFSKGKVAKDGDYSVVTLEISDEQMKRVEQKGCRI
ncbi:MAG: hypothetical protein HYX24_05780 [Candidatus Aenigmarchaeota archaeon]|nr:hypothetical protein [Candidatus Aenigmarchaeota archaeon]